MKRAALLLTLVLAACGGEPERGDPSLVVLISLDTLRAEHVSAYGYDRPTTPNLDALAAEGVLYEHAIAQATNTLISHKSMLTGKLPLRLMHEASNATREQLRDATENPSDLVVQSLWPIRPTLATSMKTAGYRTGGFADGNWMKSQFLFNTGFDTYQGEQKVGLATNGPRALEWIRELNGAKGFVFLHTYDAHCPYTPPEPFNSLFCKNHATHATFANRCPKRTTTDGFEELNLDDRGLQAVIDHYDGGIVYTDDLLGKFLNGLKAQERYDEALILVTSDHGEGLGDNGQIGHGGLYAEQVFVPLIAKFPASWEIEPRRVKDTVELTDIVPTMLEATGQAIPGDLDGRSLIGPATGERGHRYGVAQIAYNEFQGNATWLSNPVKRAVFTTDGFWMLVDEKSGERQLFALDGKRTASPITNPKLAKRMEDVLLVRENFGGGEAFKLPPERELDEETAKELRALGYLGNN